ncbi:histone-like nucleoid-structuring protein Lsr2 [Nocardia brasiliensis]|uniref:histone-like nucleoid-structuring protein Lsr2 n=1 Tax=Nocardia brasiliensis TaxID=37326 RepID=UPI0024571B0F|nr:Lsr2 family protein [Nocardia brasiliensis]
MAKKVILVDDITGEDITEGLGGTLPFMWDGDKYVIDLGIKNRDKYQKLIQPLIDAARRPTEDEQYMFGGGAGRRNPARGSKPGSPAKKADGPSRDEIRAWMATDAKFRDREISDRGRVPADILEAYEAANK